MTYANKKLLNVLFIFFLIYIDCLAAFSQFNAFHIPDNKILRVNIDGNIDEWLYEMNNYSIRDSMFDCYSNIGGDVLNSRVFVGWNKSLNRIFIVAEVYDDYFVNNPNILPYNNDCMDLFICPNSDNQYIGHHHQWGAEEGKYNNAASHSSMKITFNHSETGDGSQMHVIFGPAWIKDSIFSTCATSLKMKENMIVLTYEISISLWDYWCYSEPDLSYRHFLYEGDELRLHFRMIDSDKVIKYDKNAYRSIDNSVYLSRDNTGWWINPSSWTSFRLVTLKY